MDTARFQDSPIGRLVPFEGTDGATHRAFRHVAYVPDDLPMTVELTTGTWSRVLEASTELARLDQAGLQVPNPDLLRRPTLRREAQSTSALEGTYAPLEDVLDKDPGDRGISSALHEVLNFTQMAEAAFQWQAEERGLTLGLILQMQKTLLAGTPTDTAQAGGIRTVPVVIGSRGDRVEDARFIPPPPGPELERALSALIDWMRHQQTEQSLPPVVSAAMAHYQFETLHPFNEGNGRVGRFLVILHLLYSRTITAPLLTVSPWFEKRRGDYQDHLADLSATGDWNTWIGFFATGLAASARSTRLVIERLLELQTQYQDRIADAGYEGVIRDIASLLIGSPFVTAPALARRFGKTPAGIRFAVEKLVELRILARIEGHERPQRFVAPEVLRILSTD